MDINEMNLNAKKYYEASKDKLEKSNVLFREFLNLYPFHENPEKIDLMKPDDIYNPGKPSFLYYIEHGLADFGRISVGSVQYAINAKKQINVFKELIHVAVNDSISIAEKVDAPWNKIKYFGGDRHLAKKIIFCYNSDRIFPSYKTEHLEYFASEIDPEFKSKSNKFNKDYEDFSLGEKFEYLNDIILKFKNEFIETEMNNNSFMWFLYDSLTPPETKEDSTTSESKPSIEEGDNKIGKWTFAINKDFYPVLKEKDEIKWNSAKDVKKGDIILIYTGAPHSNIGFILKAVSDPFEDPEIRKDGNKLAVKVHKISEISEPINLSELNENPILSKWGPVKKSHFKFQGSHFKMDDKEYNELKRLILEKNPELKSDIEDLEREDEIGSNENYDNGDSVMGKRIWKITPGEAHIRKILWKLFVNNKVIGIGWFGEETDYSDFKTLEDVKKELFNFYNKPRDLSAKMIWDFTNNVEIGDVVVANSGYKGVLGIGIVESEYIGPNNPQNPAINSTQREVFQDYVHFRKVNWLITDEIEFNSQIFDQKTLTPVYEDKWDQIKDAYFEKSVDYRRIFEEIESYWPETGENVCEPGNIIKKLYKEYENHFYSIEEGITHYNKYNIERQKVKEYYELIENDPKAKFDTQDPPINHLLPIKEPSIAPVAVGTIKAFGYKDEDLPGLTGAVHDLLKNLIEKDDKKQQKELINSFKSGPYKKGFQTAMLTPVIYYLDPNFLFINKKTVSSFRFISKILGKDENISGNLVDYIDNNEKLKKLIKALSNYIPDINFEKFDEFCHWLCSGHLGNYAEDQDKFNKWILDNCPKDDNGGVKTENKFLKFLKNTYTHEMEVALGELKRGKNIILYGPPGSGKTVLSKIVSEEHLGKNAYSLYTVHSGTDYYDLVCRIVPQINEEGNLVYSKEPRFLLDTLLSGKVLILDEINRTQIDTALGIFFTYLERDHRISDVEQIREILKKETDEELEINDLRTKLNNFRIIGTLNVYDKTFLFKLGDALKRRFTFIEITTKNDLIEKLATSEEFKKEFLSACDYNGDSDTSNIIIDVFSNLNSIKPLGIGILKDSLQFSSNFGDNAADLSISSLIVPFFENDLNYSNILNILENSNLNVSISKLKSLNFGTSDINGI